MTSHKQISWGVHTFIVQTVIISQPNAAQPVGLGLLKHHFKKNNHNVVATKCIYFPRYEVQM